jgi:hypothetical protein
LRGRLSEPARSLVAVLAVLTEIYPRVLHEAPSQVSLVVT